MQMNTAPPSTSESPQSPAQSIEAEKVVSTDSQGPAIAAATLEDLEQRVVEALRTVFDPEIPVSIYELGLIYSVLPSPAGQVEIKMTLTSPHCPVAESLPGEVQYKVESVDGVQSANVDVVWDPPWSPDMMSEAAKLELGMF